MGRTRIQHFIDGRFEPGSSDFTLINPASGRDYGSCALAGPALVDEAVGAARKALSGPWARLSLDDRLDLLEAVALGIERRAKEFVRAEILDTGKPLSAASAIDIPRGIQNFRFFARLARTHGTDSFATGSFATGAFPGASAGSSGSLNYTLREPVGVVGVICPWNLPLLLMTWKVAPALACGNTVVVKPSEETPATASLLADVMNEVGLPAGVYNVVHGYGPDSAGEAIVRHPDVDALTFTGESRTGERILADAAPHLKSTSFELGGKNAALVFADCDFERAVEGTIRSVFSNCGQVCLCSERVYVERPIFERFAEALAQRATALRVGDPWDPNTAMGPLISAQHRDKVLGMWQQARDDGGDVLCGGAAHTIAGDELSGGYFVQPTVVTGLPETAAFVRNEVFGPSCHIAPFDDEDEAVRLANDSDYGLCAAVWTSDLNRAHRAAAGLHVGMVWVNSWMLRDLRTPFGGRGRSGVGREGGVHSLDFYSELKNVCVAL